MRSWNARALGTTCDLTPGIAREPRRARLPVLRQPGKSQPTPSDTRASPGAHRSGARGLFGARLLQVELQVLDVRETDLLQAAGAAAALLEVHLPQHIGRDLLELLVSGGPLGVEEARGVAGRQGDGEVPDAVDASPAVGYGLVYIGSWEGRCTRWMPPPAPPLDLHHRRQGLVVAGGRARHGLHRQQRREGVRAMRRFSGAILVCPVTAALPIPCR